MVITIKFSHEMSGRLTASYKFNLSNNFNYMIATKKSNTELADYLDKQVKTLKSNGELKKMTDKYNLKDATAK